MAEIKSIQIGDEGRYFSINSVYNRSGISSIKEEWKDVGPGKILVYRCYGETVDSFQSPPLLHEIESNNRLTINYV